MDGGPTRITASESLNDISILARIFSSLRMFWHCERGVGYHLAFTFTLSHFYFHTFTLSLAGSFGIAKEEQATIWLVRTTCSLIFATTAVTLLSRLTVERGVFIEHIKNRQKTKTCIRLKCVLSNDTPKRNRTHALQRKMCIMQALSVVKIIMRRNFSLILTFFPY